MRKLARKIIDTIQNSLLDRLALKLLPLWWISVMWEKVRPSTSEAVFLLTAGGFLILALGWLIGLPAEPRPARRSSPLERLQEGPRDGLSAWEVEPAGGLNPPGFIRILVRTLGCPRGDLGGWGHLLGATIFMGSVALIWMLAHKSPTFWTGLHPALAGAAARETLFLGAAIVLVALMVLAWAREQHDRLVPRADASPAHLSLVVQLLFSAVFVMPLCLLVIDFLHQPWWVGVASGTVASVAATLLFRLDSVSDFVFGMRNP